MFEKIRVIFSIPELRQKILLTLGLLAVYRIGWCIPLPIVDAASASDGLLGGDGVSALLTQVAMFSGARMDQMTIFGLGIMPYISASIIFQLLATVWKPLEQLQKEGESGRKKINEYTRYATILICIIQSSFMIGLGVFAAQNPIFDSVKTAGGGIHPLWAFACVMTMTAGTTFLMWLGEQIDEYGIGNGISLLIMSGILAGLPLAITKLWGQATSNGTAPIVLGGKMGIDKLIALAVMFVVVVIAVIYVTRGQRRISTQTAKHVRGRKTFQAGNKQYLPLKVNQAGVMPIIFASSLLLLPTVLFGFFHQWTVTPDGGGSLLNLYGGWQTLAHMFSAGQTYTYTMCYIALIFFFCYFWTAVTFNPKDMADNLKNYGTFLPGYRPGKRTAEYLEKVMLRITYVGAGFLSLIAILPTVISGYMGVDYAMASFFGGTGLLIAVSVCIDLVDKIDSYLIMRNYKGLLDKGGR